MAKSMTGYGKADFTAAGDSYSVEVKTLNNRYLEQNLRLPERFAGLDARLRDEIKKRYSRGTFTVNISPVCIETPPLKLNLPMARLYVEAGETLRRELDIAGHVDVQLLLKLKDIFTYDRKSAEADADWEPVKAGLTAAFAQVDEWRAKEGAALTQEMTARLGSLETRLTEVEGRGPEVIAAYRARLKQELDRLLSGGADEGRILLEAAVFAQRSDIAEEIARLKSHLTLFREYLALDEPAGKRLDFLCQEIGREINTIGSKSVDITVTRSVVEMKGEMEKIREQAQNIE